MLFTINNIPNNDLFQDIQSIKGDAYDNIKFKTITSLSNNLSILSN
jgi:hypothetical protein